MHKPRHNDGVQLPAHMLSLIFRKLISSCVADQAFYILLTCLSLVCKSWRLLLISEEEDGLLWEPLARRLSPAFPSNLGSILFCDKLSWRSVCRLHCAWAKPFLGTPNVQQPALLRPEVFEKLSDIISHLPPIPPECRRIFVCVADTSFSCPSTKVMQRHATDISQLRDAFISFTNRGGLAILSTHGKVMLQCKKLFCGLNKRRCRVAKNGMHVRRIHGSHVAAIFESNVIARGTSRESQQVGKDVIDVFVVHNINANLCSELWCLAEEPRLLVYWKTLLIYSPFGKQRPCASTILKCKQDGINGRELWCINIGLVPKHMEVNAHFVAIVASIMQTGKLFLISLHTGEIASSIDICFHSTLLLTDTFVAVSRDHGIVSVYNLPVLEELYALPFPDALGFESENFVSASMSLSPCGRFLGISGYLGELVLYDMIAHCIKYYGSIGLTFTGGAGVDRVKAVGDGVWLWYRDVEWRPGQSEDAISKQVDEKIVYWQMFSHQMLWNGNLWRV